MLLKLKYQFINFSNFYHNKITYCITEVSTVQCTVHKDVA